MAHNEGKVIDKAVERVLRQKAPTGFTIKIVVAAMDCDDRSEEVGAFPEGQYPGKGILLCITGRGKPERVIW